MAIVATILSLLIRLNLSSTGSSYFSDNYQLYNVVVTAHAIAMIFLFVMPVLIGGFGNFMVPLLFNNLHIQRKHVIQYYAMVFAAVFLFFGLYYFLSWPPLLSISRKVWTLLQGPSLFILLLFYQKILKYVK